MSQIYRLLHDESGATAIEYGLIIGLVSIVAVAAYGSLGDSLVAVYGVITTELTTVAASMPTP